jgi:hypothetical protein
MRYCITRSSAALRSSDLDGLFRRCIGATSAFLFLTKTESDESEYHQDGAGYNRPMRVLHR